MALRGWTARTGLGALLVITAGTIAVAGEGAHGGAPGAQGGGGHEAAAWLTLAYSFVNFSIFVFLLRRYAWPPLRDFLSGRRKEVVDAMAAAEKAREEVEAIRRDYAVREAALEETRRRMIEEIHQCAAADRDRSLQEAQAAAQRLRVEAERQAEHDLARARRELRSEAARLATELAEKEVRARLTDADRARIVQEFVEMVARP